MRFNTLKFTENETIQRKWGWKRKRQQLTAVRQAEKKTKLENRVEKINNQRHKSEVSTIKSLPNKQIDEQPKCNNNTIRTL